MFAPVLVPLDRNLGLAAHVDFALRLSCPGFRLSLPGLPPWASRPPAASRPQTTAPPGQPTPSLPWPTASAFFLIREKCRIRAVVVIDIAPPTRGSISPLGPPWPHPPGFERVTLAGDPWHHTAHGTRTRRAHTVCLHGASLEND